MMSMRLFVTLFVCQKLLLMCKNTDNKKLSPTFVDLLLFKLIFFFQTSIVIWFRFKENMEKQTAHQKKKGRKKEQIEQIRRKKSTKCIAVMIWQDRFYNKSY